ncbi:hypothetical protein A2765_03565 [Candidatus Kaiserbacteria bacterium RIFCSPHIGHO2_01_FULL_56_24]|uniref:Uncharacterized protein n=1 Tax=Candidatus Kaiserbacteria bacterium RIFCSPHIGHO2_01_FULL_56_24 TaxID=1798487 RepID=A0A1F6DGP6_9BACT|nr:MAG: hypothetical protein A2765_03565 [Candidatus Kaiserbacteria bacterium RIFCSPHIGHO2_01_FULL_56_24]
MNIGRILYSVLAIVFGGFMVVYGGIDDSPGGQLLGLVAVVLGIVGVIKSTKKKSDQIRFKSSSTKRPTQGDLVE